MARRTTLSTLGTLSLLAFGCTEPESDGGSASETAASETEASDSEASDSEDPGETEDSVGVGETDEDSTETDGEVHVDLFACGFSSPCSPGSFHIGPDDDRAADMCAAAFILSGEPGVILGVSSPGGPFLSATETLAFIRGDGTAVVQTRHRSCMVGEAGCDWDTLPWEPVSSHETCHVVVDEDLAEACMCDDLEGGCPDCGWNVWEGLDECEEVPDLECSDLAQ
jgi:hypothetical protein